MGLATGGGGVAPLTGAQPALRCNSPSLRGLSGPERTPQRGQAGVELGAALGSTLGERGGGSDSASGADRAFAPATPEGRSTAQEDLRPQSPELRRGSPFGHLLRRPATIRRSRFGSGQRADALLRRSPAALAPRIRLCASRRLRWGAMDPLAPRGASGGAPDQPGSYRAGACGPWRPRLDVRLPRARLSGARSDALDAQGGSRVGRISIGLAIPRSAATSGSSTPTQDALIPDAPAGLYLTVLT